MRQNEITNSDDFLHNAIDAQHDGFPSRLLDVSYNCLVALYFATTPYYSNKENSMDSKDGFVYAFKYNEAYSPEANNTKEIYLSAMNSKDILNSSLLCTNHKLIDHCKQNKRIIAQQGAFILFAGDVPEPMPYHQMYGIRVSGAAKQRIRHELKTMFGIYTGSIYPEVELMHEEIKEKCFRMNTSENNLKNNVDAALINWQKEYDYYVDCCDYFVAEGKDGIGLIRLIERNICDHKNKLKNFLGRLNAYNDLMKDKPTEQVEEKTIIKRYNYILEEFVRELPKSINKTIDTNVKKKLGE